VQRAAMEKVERHIRNLDADGPAEQRGAA